MAFEIDLLPVGNDKKSGDCIALRYGDLERGGERQTVVIVDGGYAETAESLKEHLKKYYKCTDCFGRIHINLVILSHPDNDHVSGLVALAEDKEVVIDEILMQRPWTLKTDLFKDGRMTQNSLEKRLEDSFQKAYNLCSILSDRQIDPTLQDYNLNGAIFHILGPSKEFYEECLANSEKTPVKNDSISYIQDFSIDIPDGEERYIPGKILWHGDEHTSTINESSLVFLFVYDGVKILFTGDAGKAALRQAISQAKIRGISLSDIDIIKMPHHGSRKNVSPHIVEELKGAETKCFISCASKDEGHHPSKRLVNMLLEKGFKIYVTAGNTLHWGKDMPQRTDFHTVSSLTPYPSIEK